MSQEYISELSAREKELLLPDSRDVVALYNGENGKERALQDGRVGLTKELRETADCCMIDLKD